MATTAPAAFFNSGSFLSLSSDEIGAVLSNVREVTITVERYDLYSVRRLLSLCSSFEDSDVCLLGGSFDEEDDFDTSDALDDIFLVLDDEPLNL